MFSICYHFLREKILHFDIFKLLVQHYTSMFLYEAPHILILETFPQTIWFHECFLLGWLYVVERGIHGDNKKLQFFCENRSQPELFCSLNTQFEIRGLWYFNVYKKMATLLFFYKYSLFWGHQLPVYLQKCLIQP